MSEPPKNQAERFASFLSTMKDETIIYDEFVSLVRRVWHKAGKIRLFAMVDDSFLVEADGRLMTYDSAEKVASVLMGANGLPKIPLLVEAVVRDLRSSPQKNDLEGDGITLH